MLNTVSVFRGEDGYTTVCTFTRKGQQTFRCPTGVTVAAVKAALKPTDTQDIRKLRAALRTAGLL